MSETELKRPSRRTLEIVALRRHNDSTAERLRRDVPLMLARLAAEASGSVIELRVVTHDDGAVCTEVTLDAGELTGELSREAAEVLTPVAELEQVNEATDHAEWSVWPLLSGPRTKIGFGVDPGTAPRGTRWTAKPSHLDLVGLVCVHPGAGLRLRLWADDPGDGGPQLWAVDAAVLTTGQPPSLRLRAQIRSALPGLYVGAAPTAATVLRVDAERLPGLFAVPIGGAEPMAGICIGGAAPLPALPVRGAVPQRGSVRLGSAVTVAGRPVPVVVSLQERLRHVHVLGRTGTGKSSLLAGVAHEIARGDDGMLVLDPHGHLVQRIIAELPESAVDRVWVVRCGDVDNPVPLNPLAIADPVRREIAIDDVCGAFQYLFDKKQTGIVGPRFRERVSMGLRALTAVFGDRASLLDVPAALASVEFVAKAARAAQDDRLKAWLTNDMTHRRSGEYGDLVSWVNSKFEALSSTTAMRGILGSGADAIDMADAMDNGRIVLVDLSKSTLGESATALLGYLYLNRVWTSALQREVVNRPFTVVVDEAQAMISGSLTTMLSEGRKFGLSVILAHQYLGQLDEDLRPAVDGNVATTIAFRGAVSDIPALRQRFGDGVDATTLMTLPDLSAIVMRTAADAVAEPHTLVVDHNQLVVARSVVRQQDIDVEITQTSMRDLVDPYRDLTGPAAAGKSNVVQVAADKPKPPKAPKPVDASAAGASSFLDEWLARRAQRTVPPEEADESRPA
jgi:hypothetical protein